MRAALAPPACETLRGRADRAARAQTSLIDFDKETYGEEWLPREKRNFALCGGLHLVWFLCMARPCCCRCALAARR